jgi:thioredoxin 1
MPELLTLTDASLEPVLNGEKPALILVTNGEGVRGDFNSAFKKAAGENAGLVFATIDPTRNPAAAARFEAGSKPVLIGWCGGEVLRRPRPWGSDLTLAVEQMRATAPAPAEAAPQAAKEIAPVNATPQAVIDHPVKVTDATFEQEVLNSDLPVLVDFWAEWCGPCRMVAPTLDKLAKEFAGQVKIAKLNVDENPGVAQAFRVMSIPNIMLIKNRTIVFNQPGALPEPAFRDLINQLIALEVPAKEAAPTPAN